MKKTLFLLGLSFFAFQLTCLASIDVSNQTGIIKITYNGVSTTINPGQPIPPIPNGATINIVTGEAVISTTAPSTVNLAIKGNSINLTSASTVQISLNSNGAIKVYDDSGTFPVTTIDGKTTVLNTGNTIVIAGNTPKNLEAYQPPNIPDQPINTQVQINNNNKDISPVS